MLLDKALDAIVLAIEHFNRPSDRGRPESTLMQLDHAFELFLKASILQRGGKIRRRRVNETMGFEACVNQALLQPGVKFLTDDEAMTLRIINNLRDAATHYLVLLSEDELYLHIQAGVTLFDTLLQRVFKQRLADTLPERVLPVSTKPPENLTILFGTNLKQIRALVAPGRRQRAVARARIRALALVENAIRGDIHQPSDTDLNKLLNRARRGETFPEIFPGIASVALTTEGTGLNVSLRFTTSKGLPVHLPKEEEEPEATVALKRVNELSFYSLGSYALANKVDLTFPKTLAVIRYLGLQEDPDCFKEFRIGSSRHKRYSPIAMERIKEALPSLDLNEVWEKHGPGQKKIANS